VYRWRKYSWRELETQGERKRSKDSQTESGKERETEVGGIDEEGSAAGTHLVPVLQLDVARCEVEV
jgi:hypothetical protein